jgi:integrase
LPSAFIVTYTTPRGEKRYRVRYRIGGAETKQQHAGSFRTLREARARRDWVAGELAAMRVPDLRLVVAEEPARELLRDVAERWRLSRVDVASGTDLSYQVRLARILPALGDRGIESIEPSDVATFVGQLVEDELKAETIRKIVGTLAMILDFAGVSPNPARDRLVKLPRKDAGEVNPPLASHIEAILPILKRDYRLPVLVLDATGMRVSELEKLTWGDVDEIEGRWRVSGATAKTRRARWVPVEPAVFQAVVELVPREDRDPSAQVFAGFGNERFRTALTKTCKAAGVPHFSPHDLRHRRCTLWHLSGVPVAEAAMWAGHSAQEHLRTYAHASLVDRRELDHAALIASHASTRDRLMLHG